MRKDGIIRWRWPVVLPAVSVEEQVVAATLKVASGTAKPPLAPSMESEQGRIADSDVPQPAAGSLTGTNSAASDADLDRDASTSLGMQAAPPPLV